MAKDHYIPQFYLRNFEIPSCKGWVYSYKRKMQPKPKAIRSIACEEDYYDLKIPHEELPVDNVDNILKLTENSSSPIISKLLTASSFSLTPEEFSDFIWFVAMMAIRTPFFREYMVNFATAWTDREFKKFAADKDAFNALDHKDGKERNPELREQARQALINDELDLNLVRGGQSEDWVVGLQLDQAKTFVRIFNSKYWHIVESDSSRVFVTSDHPVILTPSPYHGPVPRIGNLEGWFLFPLSPRRALLLANEKLGNKVIQLSRDKMLEYQWYTITRCHLSVFSHLLSKDFQKVLDQTEEGELLGPELPD